MITKLFQHVRQNVSYWLSRPRHILIAAALFAAAIFIAHAMFFSCLDNRGALTSVDKGVCYRSRTLNGDIMSSNVIDPYIQSSIHDVLFYVPIILVLMVLFVDVSPSTRMSKFSLRALLNKKALIVVAFLYACGFALSYNRAEQLGLGIDHQLAWNILGLPAWVLLAFSLVYVFYKKIVRK